MPTTSRVTAERSAPNGVGFVVGGDAARAAVVGRSLAWGVSFLFIVVDTVWVVGSGRTVRGLPVALAMACGSGAVAVAASMAPPTAVTRRIAGTANALATMFTLSVAVLVASYAVAAITPAPLIDSALLHADRALGFDWGRWAAWMGSHPQARGVLHSAYDQLPLETLVCVVLLGLVGDADRFLRATAVSMLVMLVVFAAFPAAGHFAHGSATHALLELRHGGVRTIALASMEGIVSFPSFHTTLALLLAYYVRRTWIAVPVGVLTVAMLVSIPAEGGHYVIDMAAGAVIAVIAAVVAAHTGGTCAAHSSAPVTER